LEIHFHKRQVSFLVVKTDKCKRGISLKQLLGLLKSFLIIALMN